MTLVRSHRLFSVIFTLVSLSSGSLAFADQEETKQYSPLLSLKASKWQFDFPVTLSGRYEQASSILLDRDNTSLESSYIDMLARIGFRVDAKDGLLPFLFKAEFEADVISGSELFGSAKDIDGLGFAGTRPLAVPGEVNFYRDSLRKAYIQASLMQYAHLIGGVMTSQWGLGLLANDGTQGWKPRNAVFHDPRGGDRVLRAMLATGPHSKRHQIFATVAFDQLLNDDIMLEGDEGHQFVGALMYGRGKPKNAGIYFVRRHQVSPARTITTNERGFGINVAEGVTDVNVIDATFSLEYNLGDSIGQFKLAGEAAYIFGDSTLAPNAEVSTREVRQLGIAAKASLDRDNHGFLVDFMFASGDGDLNDEYNAAFIADPNYTMGLLMYRHLMAGHTGRALVTASNPDIVGAPPQDVERFATQGSVSNTIAFFPRAYYQVLQREKGDRMDLEVYGGTLVAFSATPLLDPFNTRIQGGDRKNALNASAGSYLGTEIDIGFRWRQFFDSSQLTTGAEFGYLIPGSAFVSNTGQDQENVFGGRFILEYRL